MALLLDGVARIDGADTVSVGSVAVAENAPAFGPTKTHQKCFFGGWISLPSSLIGVEDLFSMFIGSPRARSDFNKNPGQLQLQRADVDDKCHLVVNCSSGSEISYYIAETAGGSDFTDDIEWDSPTLVACFCNYGTDPNPDDWIAPDMVTVWIGATSWTLERVDPGGDPCLFLDAVAPMCWGGLAGDELHSSYESIDPRFFRGRMQGMFWSPNEPTNDDIDLLAAGVSPADARLRTLFPVGGDADYWPLAYPANMGLNSLNGAGGELTLTGNATFAANFDGVSVMTAYSSRPDGTTGIDAGIRLDTGANHQPTGPTGVVGHNGVFFRRAFIVFDISDITEGATATGFTLTLNNAGSGGGNAAGRLDMKNADAVDIIATSNQAAIGALTGSPVSITFLAAGETMEIDVNDFIQAAVTAGWAKVCFVLYRLDETTEDSNAFAIGMSENTTEALRPMLAGAWEEPVTVVEPTGANLKNDGRTLEVLWEDGDFTGVTVPDIAHTATLDFTRDTVPMQVTASFQQVVTADETGLIVWYRTSAVVAETDTDLEVSGIPEGAYIGASHISGEVDEFSSDNGSGQPVPAAVEEQAAGAGRFGARTTAAAAIHAFQRSNPYRGFPRGRR